MIEQARQAIDDGEPQTEAFAGIGSRWIELRELAEDLAVLFGRNAPARIPDLNSQPAVLASAPQKHSTAVRVAHCIREQVAHDPLEQ